MFFPFFFARKYIFSKKETKLFSFISAITVAGIAVGVAALIIALSILKGFESALTNKIISFNSHIQITAFGGNLLPDYKKTLPLIERKIEGSYSRISPYLAKLAIVSHGDVKDGVTIKGLNQEILQADLKNDLVAGSFNLASANGEPEKIVIGKKLANRLFVKPGDKITVFALTNNQIPSPENMPNIEQFIVGGVFESGMAEFDDLYAYVSLKSAQALFGSGDNINGYDIKLKRVSEIDSLAFLLEDNLRYPHYVKTIYESYRNIFTWIELQKKPIPIILGLIIVVAVFNIIGTILIVVLEKTNSIGALKSMGAANKQIVMIFIIQGVFLSCIGIAAGNILAFLLMFVQLQFNIISLPSDIYLMSTVPIQMEAVTFAMVSLIALGLSILSAIIPSYIASKTRIVNTLRFN
jgi:lipoprotein-releasing system permease protein